MPYYVYIILCKDGTFYTGSTKNLEERARLHADGRGARYTKSHPPVGIEYFETFLSRSEAMQREKAIKKLSHLQKQILINLQDKNRSRTAPVQSSKRVKYLPKLSPHEGIRMPKPKPSWTDKLNDAKTYPEVKPITGNMTKKWGTGTMVIPAPIEVDEFMRKVPKGKLITINNIRVALARKHKATMTCPITTGIFSWISAQAAEEQREKGEETITPYWRTLKTGGLLNEKYPGGVEAQKLVLEAEGHFVAKKGKNYVVQNFENSLAEI
jgi:predicted GIY-YIG superfamily endonuclease